MGAECFHGTYAWSNSRRAPLEAIRAAVACLVAISAILGRLVPATAHVSPLYARHAHPWGRGTSVPLNRAEPTCLSAVNRRIRDSNPCYRRERAAS